MTTKTRFLTGSLASLAIASAVTLAAPGAYAAEGRTAGCGQPAAPAVYVTVVTEPVLQRVPAVTHDEWRWQRDVTVVEHQYAKVVTPARTEADWRRAVPGTVELEWTRTVIDRAAVPAVPGTAEVGHLETVVVTPAVMRTLVEYQQRQTGALRWEPDGWNGEKADEDAGRGWTRTGRTQQEVVTPAATEQRWVVDQPATEGTPAVEALSHVDHLWAASSPGADWTTTGEARTVGGGIETATTDGPVPSGTGWILVETRTQPAVVDLRWAVEAPDGFVVTDAAPVARTVHEQTDDTSATSPQGDGWSQIPDSLVEVVDQPESSELVGESTSRDILVSPAVDATPPCPEGAAGGDVAADTGSAAGPRAQGVAAAADTYAADPTAEQAVSESAATSDASEATVLPATGSPVSPLLLTAGLGALLTGGVLVRSGRRRHVG